MSDKRPLILIAPSDHTFDSEYERRPKFELYKNYGRSIYAGGGIPVICAETDLAEKYAEICDGLMFTGDSRSNEYSKRRNGICVV